MPIPRTITRSAALTALAALCLVLPSPVVGASRHQAQPVPPVVAPTPVPLPQPVPDPVPLPTPIPEPGGVGGCGQVVVTPDSVQVQLCARGKPAEAPDGPR